MEHVHKITSINSTVMVVVLLVLAAWVFYIFLLVVAVYPVPFDCTAGSFGAVWNKAAG